MHNIQPVDTGSKLNFYSLGLYFFVFNWLMFFGHVRNKKRRGCLKAVKLR